MPTLGLIRDLATLKSSWVTGTSFKSCGAQQDTHIQQRFITPVHQLPCMAPCINQIKSLCILRHPIGNDWSSHTAIVACFKTSSQVCIPQAMMVEYNNHSHRLLVCLTWPSSLSCFNSAGVLPSMNLLIPFKAASRQMFVMSSPLQHIYGDTRQAPLNRDASSDQITYNLRGLIRILCKHVSFHAPLS